MIRTEETKGDKITLGKGNFADPEKYDRTFAIIHYEIYDERIRHGSTCTDYSKLQSSYKDCFLKSFQLYLIEKFGCILPIASLQTKDRSKFLCRENGNAIDQEMYDVSYTLLFSIFNEMHGDFLHRCLPPCTT